MKTNEMHNGKIIYLLQQSVLACVFLKTYISISFCKFGKQFVVTLEAENTIY